MHWHCQKSKLHWPTTSMKLKAYVEIAKSFFIAFNFWMDLCAASLVPFVSWQQPRLETLHDLKHMNCNGCVWMFSDAVHQDVPPFIRLCQNYQEEHQIKVFIGRYFGQQIGNTRTEIGFQICYSKILAVCCVKLNCQLSNKALLDAETLSRTKFVMSSIDRMQ